MNKTTLALAAAMAVVCARAEAAVYTTSSSQNFTVSDITLFEKATFVPAFNLSLGSLNSTTLTLTGYATSLVRFFPGQAPTAGSFSNSVQINNAPVSIQPSVAISNSSGTATSIQDNFAVSAPATFGSSYVAAQGQPLDVLIRIASSPSQGTYLSSSTQFAGTLLASYDYTPVASAVPEPISAALLMAPLAGLLAARRRAPTRP